MHFNVISLFPDLIKSYFEFSIVKRAKDAGVITVDTINPRDFSTSKHNISVENIITNQDIGNNRLILNFYGNYR